MQDLKEWWQSHYGSAIPVAHLLRQQVKGRWFRIHSLPESKRYLETPDEYSILLSRHNSIATEILGSHSECLLLVGRYTEHVEQDVHWHKLPEIEEAKFVLLDIVQVPEVFEMPAVLSIFCTPVIWSSGRFDELITTVADDRDAYMMFASLETGEAYAPYDGGADLFLSSTVRRDELKQQFSPWLSKHPQGF
jgi:hypothetical protein